MVEIRCYHCDESVDARVERGWVPCASCDQLLDIPIARRLRATAEMLETLLEPDLDPKLAIELRRISHRHYEELKQQGLEATEAKAVPPPEPPPTPVRRARPAEPTVAVKSARSGPSLWARLGPLFAENLLFALGGFLLLAGAVYLVTTAWTSMTGQERLLVIAGGLELFGALLYGTARLVRGREGLENTERVLLLVAAALVPVAMVAAGQLTLLSPPLGLAVAAVILASAWFPLRSLATTEDQRLHPWFTGVFMTLAAAVLLAPHLSRYSILTLTGLGAGVIGVCALLGRRLRSPAAISAAWIAGSLVALGAAVFAGDLAMTAAAELPMGGYAVSPIGMLLAALGFGVLFLERVGREAGRGSVPVLVGAFALAITGVVVATGDERCLMVAAWLATATGMVLSFRLKQPILVFPALGLSVVAYLLLPAPVRILAMELRDAAAGSLGYEPERLPLSFYGLTFAPYLALVGLLTSVLRRAQKVVHARNTEGWMVSVFLGLAAMSLVLGTDMRAPMAVLSADGLVLVAMGVLLRRELSILLGTLGLYGGAVCGLVHLQASPGLSALALAALALVGLGTASRLTRGQEAGSFRYRGGRAVFRAVCVVTLGTVVWVGLPVPGLTSSGHDLPGFGLAAVLVFAVAGTLRQPLAAVLAVPALVRAVLGGLALFGSGLGDVWTPVALSLGMGFWLGAWKGLERLLPWRGPGPPLDLSEPVTGSALGLGAMLVQLAGFWSLQAAWQAGIFPWPLALGVGAGALLLGLAGVLGRRGWCVWLAAFQLALAGVLAAASLGFSPGHLAGSIGVAVAAILATVAPRLARGEQQELLNRSAVPAGLVLAALTGLWLAGARLAAIPDPLPPEGAWSLMNGAFLLVGLGLFQSLEGRTPRLRACAAALAGTLFVVVPIAFLDLVEARGAVYPLAFLATAALLYTFARRYKAALGLILLQAATAATVALAVGRVDTPATWLQLASFAGTAVVAAAVLCRATGRPFTYPASLLLFLGLIGALCLDIADGLLAVDPRYQVALLLAISAGFVFAAPRMRVAVSRAAALTVAVPVFAATELAYGFLALWVWTGEPPRGAIFGTALTPAVDLTAIAWLAMAVALGSCWKNGFKVLLTSSLVLAAFATAPINGLVEWSRAVLWRPDVECALIGALISGIALWRVHRRPVSSGRRAPRGSWVSAAYVPAVLGVLLTAGELHHVSTPLTVLVATAVPLLALRHEGSGSHAALHGLGVLATFWSWTLYLVSEGQPLVEILPVLGLEAAALGWLLPRWGRVIAGDPARRDRVIAQMSTVGIFCLGLALSCVAIDAIALGVFRQALAEGLPLTLGVLACALVAAKAWHLSRERAGFIHLFLLAILVAYAFLALRTAWLSILDGHHQDVLIVVAMTLFVAVGKGGTERRRELIGAAMILPLPGLLGLPVESPQGRTVTLFLVSVAYGLGSLTTRRRPLGLLALVFLNLALFSFWLSRGIYDPAFYGVPAGVSILLLTEIAQRRLRAPQTAALRFCGLALLYGSVAIQVLRVEEPGHALVLFGLGLVSVLFGFLRMRNDLVLGGTLAVVIDVLAYLAVHGLEQDFVGPFLLIASGITVLTVATMTAKRRQTTGQKAPH